MAHLWGETGADILIIEGPPRHGKSEQISKWTPAWYLGRHPDHHVMLTSYEANIAASWGRKVREIIREHGAEWWGVEISVDRSAASDWNTTHGGGMLTAGVGGPLTGRGAHLLIVDDYLKNAEKAMSERIRQTQWDWWQSTVLTRLEPGGKVIVMATRWHEDDLIGRLLKQAENTGKPIARLSMPAIAEDEDSLGREIGAPLWPERWPLEALESTRSRLERFWWLSLYQQKPSRHTSAEWGDEVFEGVMVSPEDWPDRFEISAIAIDPSKGATTKPGDYFALVWAGLAGGKLWIDARLDRGKDAAKIVGDCIRWTFNGEHPVDGVGIESNAFQFLLAPEFDRQCEEQGVSPLPIHLIHNTGNKGMRIARVGPYLTRGNLRFRDNPGTRLLVDQLKDFPLGDYDDGPDALEQVIRLILTLSTEEPLDSMEAFDFNSIG